MTTEAATTNKRIAEVANALREIVSDEPHPLDILITRIVSTCQAEGWGPLESMRSEMLAAEREHRFNTLSAELEGLPVLWDRVATKKPLYFLLDIEDGRSGWLPCYNAELEPGKRSGWFGIENPDGSRESAPAVFPYWAHCNADGNPCIVDDVNE